MPAPPDQVVLRNVRQHNLKGITVSLPRRAFTVITGPSGSGKSSLAFDTLYAEGQRRYIESLSSYAKQFLERMPKPLLDSLEGLSPAVAIEQKNPTTSSRSTVGTATEIYDFLRLMWARTGTTYCRNCGNVVKADTVQEVVDGVTGNGNREALKDSLPVAGIVDSVTVAFPLPGTGDRPDVEIAAQLKAAGFVRVQLDGEVTRLDTEDAEARIRAAKEVLILVDRVNASAANRGRLTDAVSTAFAEGDGVALLLTDGGHRRRFSEQPACSNCGRPAPVPTPNLFSFNNPRGACPGCNGFGAVLEYDESLIIPDQKLSLAEGALDPWTKPRYEGRRRILRDAARTRGVSVDAPWQAIPAADREFFLHGTKGRFVGMFPFLERLEEKRYKQYIRVFLRQYQLAKTCPQCGGARLQPDALAVKVAGKTVAEVSALTATALTTWLQELSLPDFQQAIAEHILEELVARVRFVVDVGLGYLTLDRQTRTLSGGEAQRIALSNALGAHLVDTTYVLDEPSIGLHPGDTDRLLGLLRRLADAGNTVVVVEHDPAAMAAADYMVELGPGSGENGGHVVYQGPAARVREAGTLTGQYLSGEKRIGVPSARRPAGPRWLTVRGARLHNLEGVNVRIPLGTLTVVTGVSGSGKSTLVHDVIYRQLESRIKGGHSAKEHLGEAVGAVSGLTGWEGIADVVLVDQSPIGRTPRSNPVTYVKAFDELRALYASTPLARERGYTPSTFSFNVAGGRCDACEGAGHVQIEMVFLADVFVPCEICGGRRYKREILDVKVDGRSIHETLQLTVDQALSIFHRQGGLARTLWHLQQVGLGYLRLGQPATTLSGGEAQRLKIARELSSAGARSRSGRKLYILDEPTTGLHLDDVRTLCRVLDRLVDAGHTVLVIEHHLDVIKRADWVIDLGPGAGADGGRVVAEGNPEVIAKTRGSVTGRYLAEAS
ncbi:MAG TPA: excinuclease ABC subunit UvrA [Gemmatimonadales bacterium]|nr:excinuclease ABC subunit UvrA [Gemmatimonadales bacterium]